MISGRRRWNSRTMFLVQWLPSTIGTLAIILIPSIHMWVLYYFFHMYSREVDEHTCRCECWDTVFKGPYESGVGAYKHMYFNATENMFKIWTITILAAISLYECLKYFVQLIVSFKLRYSMLILFISSIFAHYYGWWMYTNYYNDCFYSQFYHQLFFSITELICTAMVVHLAHVDHEITIRKVLLIVGISILHILAGGFDQFVWNVVRGNGRLHQIIRDVWFMVPDLMHCFVPLFLLQKQTTMFSTHTKSVFMDRRFRRDFIIMFGIVSLLVLFSQII